MLVLDTDHLSEYQKGTSPEAHRLKQRLDDSAESYATTIITVEEIMRGLDGSHPENPGSTTSDQCLCQATTALSLFRHLECSGLG